MITDESPKREIRDLQRLLIALGHLNWTVDAKSGVWGRETQEAVLAGYHSLGWDHPRKGTWVTSAALAAMAAQLAIGAAGGGGSHIGGGGSHIGGGGSHIGGGGSHIGGGGSHIGGGGSHIGGGGSHIG